MRNAFPAAQRMAGLGTHEPQCGHFLYPALLREFLGRRWAQPRSGKLSGSSPSLAESLRLLFVVTARARLPVGLDFARRTSTNA